MRDFFELFNNLKRKSNAYRIKIGWNTITDWSMQLSKGNTLEQEEIFFIQAVEEKELFAKAYLRLSEYMSETYGGY